MTLSRILASAGLLALAACGPQPATPPSPSPTASSAPTSAGTVDVKLAFIVLEDNGASGKKIGCDDSVVTMTCAVPNRGTAVESALAALLDGTTDYTAAGRCRMDGTVPGTAPTGTVSSPAGTAAAYMNALASKGLTLAGVSEDDPIENDSASNPDLGDEEFQVRLTGTPAIAGVCEPPRLTAQIEETVLANAPGADDVEIELNGEADNWDDLGDGRGE